MRIDSSLKYTTRLRTLILKNCFPFPASNMSDRITYNSFYSQLVRFSAVCSKFNDFDIRSRNLLESSLTRGFSKYRLKNSFNKFVLSCVRH